MEPVPVDHGNKDATFTGLANDFNLDKKVLVLLNVSPMENLEDFRFYFTAETEIDTFVSEDSTLTAPALRIQVARLRRAWASDKCRKA